MLSYNSFICLTLQTRNYSNKLHFNISVLLNSFDKYKAPIFLSFVEDFK